MNARLLDHIRGIEELAEASGPLFQRLIDDGVISGLERALAEIDRDAQFYE